MALCTAAISLAQLEIVREQVARRDRMIRLLSRLVGEVPGVTPLPIPSYMNVYSAWMFGLSIAPEQFRCTTDEFAAQLVQAGIPGAGTGRYYLMPMALTFLQRNAHERRIRIPGCPPPGNLVMMSGPARRLGSLCRRGFGGRPSARSTPKNIARWLPASWAKSRRATGNDAQLHRQVLPSNPAGQRRL
jgi:hypothetical protein